MPVLVVDGTTRNLPIAPPPRRGPSPLKLANSIFPEDKVSTVPTSNFITSGAIGEQVTINRATPVTLNLYNSSQTVRTHAKTVGELWWQKENSAGAKRINPCRLQIRQAGQQVYVVRNGVTTTTVTEDIAMPKHITDATLARYAPALCAKPDHPANQSLFFKSAQW